MSFTAVIPLPRSRAHSLKPKAPVDSEPLLAAIRWLIETLVLGHLEAITDQIKRLEVSDVASPRHRRAIRLREVLQLLAISKSSLYDRLNPKSVSHDPALPRPFKLGNSDRSPTVWWHHEVLAYLQSHADLQRAT